MGQAPNSLLIDTPVIDVVVLAAGQGTRMRSQIPKVLHPLAGKPLLQHALDTATSLSPRAIHVVVGHAAGDVQSAISQDVDWVVQQEQLGTGHAVLQAMPNVADDSIVLVLYGDVPLVSRDTLERCVTAAADGALGVVTADFVDPAALGRIVRDGGGAITEIVEFKDANPAQREIKEINSGIMALSAKQLNQLLADVKNDNAQSEYYLTDCVALAVANNIEVRGLKATRPEEVTGVNDRVQLAELERVHQLDLAEALMRDGVTLADPARLDIRGNVQVGQDSYIDVNVVIEGEVTIGAGTHIESGCVISDSTIGPNAHIKANTVIEGANIASDCAVGPFARIRPGSNFGVGVKVGNFVETKKATLGAGTKAGHLTYLGDATIGDDCNIGAGTVTCNYDGSPIKKHTTVGNGVFVGTNSTLVAPVTVGNDSFVAAGSTVTIEVPDGDLAVGRGKQRNISGWTPPSKRKT